jgi:hypothetical protein
MIAQTCDSCSKVQCNAKTTSSTSKTSSGVGAIVGGLFGGLAAAGLIGFVVYTRCIKKKKARMSMAASAAEKENDFGMLKSARVHITKLGFLSGQHTDNNVGFYSHRRFDCFHRSYPCVKRYPDRVYPWSHESLRPFNSISPRPACSTSSRYGHQSSYFTISSITLGWRLPILCGRHLARFHVHCQ